jgi:hypothetical protein
MTLERPMFPPVADVIQFSDFAAARRAKQAPPDALAGFRAELIAKRKAKLLEITTSPENFTETCKNSRLRLSRRDAWWAADHLTDYWRARLDWWSALSIAQTHGIADANSYPKCDDYGQRSVLVDLWRDALLAQMLTPAPDQIAVNWKLAKLRGRDSRLNFAGEVNPERLQRAVDTDIEWLKAHPSRKSNGAVRQTRKGRELAAVVAIMPTADQQAIRATVREMLRERDQ